ncbi:Glycine betaine/carnitine/choline ABC transporter, ATP-binding protein [Lactobacillus helsingborgensis]|uniref:ABC-type quaternary amine transporter n=1 Tax=Lactobacillus helsingborgensis TaxID=1218494 RepID=A0AA47B4G3_9LACO|nr:ABC transporter ATP-binding protein [Lactobacillus helsingborgensis]KJY66217.1 Glycine betaine/carnitine/choline ABC transporter, ATP-binding protein [Lactobacillus helsingborgensis]MBC6356670.1 ABC transporter ATP-binding protein [Lactobacillus helsingborgensis]MCT6812326.1 ABC transporter ATP-binding protein [Lactobacillus helsingborgensis]UZX29936.1 ABC transporter ATP-binding protein [Lactobacillus helsingborgensis]WLT00700.1 ABC transporter ATP-binding protein [Lactobacillus helsingbor
MTSAIKFEHVKKSFADKVVVNDLNLDIQQGELFVLVGNSGSGKTTSIKMINRLEDPNGGRVLVNQRPTTEYNVQKLRWQIGYVLQQIALFPNMTVAKNITLIPEIQGDKGNLAETAAKLLQEVGLNPEEYAKRYPHELSGGEQQRIGILRAIASKPPIVLMDEPFSALDPLSRANLQSLVVDLHKQLHNTIIFVTHDMNEALRLADRIAIMKDGQLLQVDQPQEILRHPANKYVKDFFKGSLGNDLYETPLRQAALFNEFKQKETATLASMTKVKADEKLAKVLAILSEQEEVAVQNENGAFLGFVDRQWLVAYLNGINKLN